MNSIFRLYFEWAWNHPLYLALPVAGIQNDISLIKGPFTYNVNKLFWPWLQISTDVHTFYQLFEPLPVVPTMTKVWMSYMRISLPQLANPFTSWPSNIRPVCQPSAMSPPWGFDKLTIAGWGRNDQGQLEDDLKYVRL